MSSRLSGTQRLLMAAQNGNIEEVKRLVVDESVELNPLLEVHGESAFMRACKNNRLEVVRFLLKFSAREIRYDSTDFSGYTPLMHACKKNLVDVVGLLSESDKINPNLRKKFTDETALWIAASEGNKECIERILASKRTIDTGEDNEHIHTSAEIAEEEHPGSGISELIEAYNEDPNKIRKHLRQKLGLDETDAADLLSLVVYFSDQFFITRPPSTGTTTDRFFKMNEQLPLELQMIICRRAAGLPGDLIGRENREKAFKKHARS